MALNYTALYSALVPGTDSVYRDGRISDSGAARFAAYLLAVALREAVARELSGYVAVDSPRRAVEAVRQSPGSPVVEVTVTRQEALRRAQQHIASDSRRSRPAGGGRMMARRLRQKCKKMVAIRTTPNATCYRLIRAASDRTGYPVRQRAIQIHVERRQSGRRRRATRKSEKRSGPSAARRALAARGASTA